MARSSARASAHSVPAQSKHGEGARPRAFHALCAFAPMRRRELFAFACGAVAVALPVRAQQKAIPVIGVLNTGSPGPSIEPFMAAFRQGLSEVGYVEGQNVAIEYRWAEGHYDRLPALAAD